MEVLFFLYMCPQVVLLGKSNIALFALRFTFGHIGGDTFEAVKKEPGYTEVSFFYKCVLATVVSTKNNILDASTQVLLFVHVYSRVLLFRRI